MSAFVRYVWFCLVVGSIVVIPSAGFAQDPAAEKQTTEKTEAGEEESKAAIDPRLRDQLRSPRRTMNTFLQAVNENRLADAAECLDFADQMLTEEAKSSGGGKLAFKLKDTIDRMTQVDLERIPAGAAESQPYRLAYQTGNLDDADIGDAALITIERSEDGLWRFSPATVDEIDDLYIRWQSREKVVVASVEDQTQKPFSIRLEELYSENQRKTHFLFPDYQWINIIILILVGFLADFLTRGLLNALTSTWFRFRRGEKPPEQKRLWRPVGLFAQALVWYVGTLLIGLPTWTLTFLLGVLKAFAVVVAIWTIFHFVDLLTKVMQRNAAKTETKFDDLLMPLISKSLKVITVCIGVLVCAEAFNWHITGLLAGLGIGGMALALASQDAVSNLFGSITVLLDRPFEVGDWVVTGDVEGTVETVGFRSTRIRTFYNSLVTVPNSQLTTAIVDNLGKRRYRRIKTMLGLQYDATPEQIDAFCEGVRELIRRHPFTRKDYYHVYLNQFGGSSLDILLYCFLECPDWSIELRERHRLFIDILKLADELGVSFAFPTRTLHMFQEDATPKFDMSRLGEPQRAGQRTAAKIAGPLLAQEDRPDGVQFPGPSPFDDNEPRR